MKYVSYVLSLLPLGFLFSYLEIEYSSIIAFYTVAILTLTIGAFTTTLTKRQLLLLKLIAIGLSVVLAQYFINPPNESWFNPFSMTTSIIIIDSIIMFIHIAIRSFLKSMREPKIE